MHYSTTSYQMSKENTNVVKGIAILMMLCHHLFLDDTKFSEELCSIASFSKVCVAVFIFLSGYGMGIQWPEKDYRKKVRYIFRRFFKFYLNYWTIFLWVIPLGVLIFERSLDIAYGNQSNILWNFLLDFWGLKGFDSYNTTWWFNKVILCLWLLFPAIHFFCRNLFVASLFLLLLIINPGDILWPLHFFADLLGYYLLPYALGICIATNRKKIDWVLNKLSCSTIIGVSFFSALILLFARDAYFDQGLTHAMSVIDSFASVSIALFVTAVSKTIQHSFLSLQFVGRHSMNIYLLHTFVFSYFFHDFVYHFENPLIIFIIVFSTSLAVSMCLEFIKRHLGFYKLINRL